MKKYVLFHLFISLTKLNPNKLFVSEYLVHNTCHNIVTELKTKYPEEF